MFNDDIPSIIFPHFDYLIIRSTIGLFDLFFPFIFYYVFGFYREKMFINLNYKLYIEYENA
jgi:hypothetical protein